MIALLLRLDKIFHINFTCFSTTFAALLGYALHECKVIAVHTLRLRMLQIEKAHKFANVLATLIQY